MAGDIRNFTPRTNVLDTDKFGGVRGVTTVSGARPESVWTALTLRTWLASLFATAEQLDAKAEVTALADHLGDAGNPHGVTKAQVGLGSADNTADADKPVSTLQAAALALKAPLASPALTGTPTAPTAAVDNASTQLATTLFVANAIAGVLNGAPGALDTLLELSAALGDDPNFATTVTNAVATKLAKSANLADLTDASAARTNLALVPGTDVQAYSALLAALVGLTSAADKLPYFTGVNTAAVATITSFARSVLAAADAADARTVLGLGSVTNTADADKPVSTAQQTALDTKADKTASLTTVPYAASIVVDFLSPVSTVTLTGNITLSSANLAAVRSVTLRIVGDTTDRTLTFPAGWKFVGGVAPPVLPGNKTAVLSLVSFGTSDAAVVAAYAAEV